MRSLLASLLVVLPTYALRADEPALKPSKEEQAIVDLVNKERDKAQLPALAVNPKLMQAAREHAANMAKQMKMEHELDGKNVSDRVKALGYDYRAVGENIAFGVPMPSEVMRTWMNSKAHRENILRDNFTEIGVGMLLGRDGRPYWVQVFGSQLK